MKNTLLEDFEEEKKKRLFNLRNNVTDEMPSLKYGETTNLKGETERTFKKIGDGSRIVLFEKTPYPENPSDVVCPHFVEFKWANGCPFNCSWCYLQGTFRFLDRGKKPYVKDLEKTEKHLDTFLQKVNGEKYVLNTGELSDSLIGEDLNPPFSKWVINKFENGNPNHHKVLFLTKSNKIENLLDIEDSDYAIMSFSLNAPEVAERWEGGANIEDRIEAAKKMIKNGYETRIRIDPMVPIDGWSEKYEELIDMIFSSFEPERITLGSLRGLSSTIRMADDTTWTKYLKDSSNWGKKVSSNLRIAMYSTVKNYLEKNYGYVDIALCKETREIWEKLNMDWKNIRCNCIK